MAQKRFSYSLRNGERKLTVGEEYTVSYVFKRGNTTLKQVTQDFPNYQPGSIEDYYDQLLSKEPELGEKECVNWINIYNKRERI
jgi:hypothetical protein